MRLSRKLFLASDLGITPTNDGTSIALYSQNLQRKRTRGGKRTLRRRVRRAKVAVAMFAVMQNDTLKKMEKSTDITKRGYLGARKAKK